MMNALRCELVKLRRRGVLLGFVGTIVGIALLVAIILFATAKPLAEIQAEAQATAGQPNSGGPAMPIETLQQADGYTVPFRLAGQIVGVVALVLFAQNVGSEYGQGTLKVLFSREPRRIRVLIGKLVALSLLAVAAILAAFLLQTLAAYAVAAGQGIDTSAWMTAAASTEGLLLLLRVCGSAIIWGVMGAFLAVVLRTSAAAIGIGIGYTILIEPILAFALKGATKWLPGQALQSFTAWGTSTNPQITLLPPELATIMVAIYGIAFAAAAAFLLVQRDVST